MEPKNNTIKVSEETQINLPSPRNLMYLEKRDWLRIKRMIRLIKSSNNRWDNAAWFSASVVITCLITALTFQGDQQKIFFGISIASFIITVILFIASKAFSDSIVNSKEQVIIEMEEIEKNIRINPPTIMNNDILEIIEAVYGTDLKQNNITDQIIRMVKDNRLIIHVSNTLGGDPDSGTIKKLKLIYQFNGNRVEKEYLEGQLINIP